MFSLDALYSNKARILPETPDEPIYDDEMIDFTFGHPDPTFFPTEIIRESTLSVLDKSSTSALQYSIFRGSESLLDSLTSFLSLRSHIHIKSENLLITNGSMQVLGLMGQVLINPGDVVITESPTYFRAVTIFRNCGAEIVDSPIDENGLNINLLCHQLEKFRSNGKCPKIIYTIPSYQNPSGVTMSLERRKQLLAASSEYGFLILEDTAYNDLWYDSPPSPSLYELDNGNGKVVQMGTFSKIIAPGLSIGWTIGPASLITRMVEFKDNGGTTPFTASIVAEIIKNDKLDLHINSLRSVYKAKRNTMIAALETYMIDLVSWVKPGGGYFIWLEPKETISLDNLWQNAIIQKVLFLPGKYCYANGCPSDQGLMRLAFSGLNANDIVEGIKRLSIAVRESI